MVIELDPTKVSPQTHTFVGMYRQPFGKLSDEVIAKINSGKGSFCGVCVAAHFTPTDSGKDHFSSKCREKLHACWLAGHFDIPQWKTIHEPVQSVIDDIADRLNRKHWGERLAQIATPDDKERMNYIIPKPAPAKEVSQQFGVTEEFVRGTVAYPEHTITDPQPEQYRLTVQISDGPSSWLDVITYDNWESAHKFLNSNARAKNLDYRIIDKHGKCLNYSPATKQ